MSNTKMRLPLLAYSMVSKWWHEYQDVVEVVVVDDASMAKMSGGDVDVEPYLNSRNTSRTRYRNSNFQRKIGPKLSELEVVSDGGMRKYMWAREQNLAKYGWKMGGGEEVMLPGAGCPGLMAGCMGCRMFGLSGRMSGLWIRGRT